MSIFVSTTLFWIIQKINAYSSTRWSGGRRGWRLKSPCSQHSRCKMSIFVSTTLFWIIQKFRNSINQFSLTVVLDGVVVDEDGVWNRHAHNTRGCKMSIFVSTTVFWVIQKFRISINQFSLTVVLVDGIVVVDEDGVVVDEDGVWNHHAHNTRDAKCQFSSVLLCFGLFKNSEFQLINSRLR
jgi:hypothetical protein